MFAGLRLRRWWRSHARTQQTATINIDSIMPASGSSGVFQNKERVTSQQAARQLTTPQTQHRLTGAWQLHDVQASIQVSEGMSSFIIEGTTLMLSNGVSLVLDVWIEPNTVQFKDAILTLAEDDVCWVECLRSSKLACFQRVHLPHPEILSVIQGSWECRSSRFGKISRQQLTIKGPFWHMRDEHTSRRGVVHAHIHSGEVVIQHRAIQIASNGNLWLKHSGTNSLKFRWAAVRHRCSQDCEIQSARHGRSWLRRPRTNALEFRRTTPCTQSWMPS